MPRVRIRDSDKRKIEARNAGVCCVCRKTGFGTNIHHIDHDPSNNSSDNLALICVKDHDANHRPGAYHPCHHLPADELRRYKAEWEDFVARARSNPPRVLAVLNVFGSEDHLHAVRLAMQDETGRIGFEHDFHFLDISMDEALDEVFERITWLNPEIVLHSMQGPSPIEYCSCKKSLTDALLPVAAAKELAADWSDISLMAIYVNPNHPSCAITLHYKGEEPTIEWSLHRCGGYLSLREIRHEGATDPMLTVEYKIAPRPSVRSQATKVVADIIGLWSPGRYLIGTDDPDEPRLIEDLVLPQCWENPRIRMRRLRKSKSGRPST